MPVRGRFLWHDLLVPGVEAAVRFYAPFTGWTAAPMAASGEDLPYSVWANAGVPVARVRAPSAGETSRGLASHWLAYIGTSDVDATYAEAVALGARGFVPPRDAAFGPATDVAPAGRVAVLADPQGVLFGLYQPAGPSAPSTAVPGAGAFTWHELETTDRRASFTFYAQLFGWASVATVDMGPNGVYQIFGQGGTAYGGMLDRRHDGPAPHWRVFVTVADLARALDALRDGGGQVLAGPMDVPGDDCVAHCADPQGSRFALHALGHC